MDIIELIRHKIESTLSSRRLDHTHGTAQVCLYLADRFSLDFHSALIASLWHDCCREWDSRRLKHYVSRFALEITPLEEREVQLLHGPAAACRLFHELSCRNWDIWRAVRWHTTGSTRMGSLGYALFVADFIEPHRSHLDDLQREQLLSLDTLEEMMLHIYRMQFAWFEHQQICIEEESLGLYRQLEERWA